MPLGAAMARWASLRASDPGVAGWAQGRSSQLPRVHLRGDALFLQHMHPNLETEGYLHSFRNLFHRPLRNDCGMRGAREGRGEAASAREARVPGPRNPLPRSGGLGLRSSHGVWMRSSRSDNQKTSVSEEVAGA